MDYRKFLETAERQGFNVITISPVAKPGSYLDQIERTRKPIDEKTLIVVTEGNQLSREHYDHLCGIVKETGARLLVEGNPSDLEPVNSFPWFNLTADVTRSSLIAETAAYEPARLASYNTRKAKPEAEPQFAARRESIIAHLSKGE